MCSLNMPCLFSLPPANEVWGKVIFLHLSVILFTVEEEYLGRYTLPDQVHPMDQVHPQDQVPPRTRNPPDQVHPPGPGTSPRTRYTPLGPGTPPRTRYTSPPGDQVHPQGQVHPPGPGTPPTQVHPQSSACWETTSGRYACYWNAFLFIGFVCLPLDYHCTSLVDENSSNDISRISKQASSPCSGIKFIPASFLQK